MSNRAKLNGWRSNRSSAHASASGHLWRLSAVITGVHAKRPPVVPASGLVDPTLGDPARGPASWRRRSITQGYCENQVAEGPFSVGKSRFLPSVAFVQRVRRSRIVLVRSGCKTPQSGYSLGRL